MCVFEFTPCFGVFFLLGSSLYNDIKLSLITLELKGMVKILQECKSGWLRASIFDLIPTNTSGDVANDIETEFAS